MSNHHRLQSLAVPRARADSSHGTFEEFTSTRAAVMKLLSDSSSFSEKTLEAASRMFFSELGLPRQYFVTTSPDTIAKHISSLQAARELAASSGRRMDLQLHQEDSNSAFFAARSTISTDRTGAIVRKGDAAASPVSTLERYIESKYLSQGENTHTHALTASVMRGTDGAGLYSLSSTPSAAGSAPVAASWRLQCYRSKGVLQDGAHLRLYFLQQPEFVNPTPAFGETRLTELGDAAFLRQTAADMIPIYEKVVAEASRPGRMGPSMHVQLVKDISEGEDFDVSGVSAGQEVDSVLLVIGHKAGSTHSYFTGMTDVYRWYGMFAVSKTVEVFSNGVIVFAFKLRALDLSRLGSATPAPGGFAATGNWSSVPSLDSSMHSRMTSSLPADSARERGGDVPRDRRTVYTSGGPDAPTLEERVRDMERDVALHFVLPRTSVSPLLRQGVLSAQEAAYAYSAWKFAFHFMSRMSAELNALVGILKGSAAAALGARQGEALSLVSKLRNNVQTHSFTEAQILDAIFDHPDIIAWLYLQFQARHRPSAHAATNRVEEAVTGVDGSSPATRRASTPLPYEAALAALKKMVKSDEEALEIFRTMLLFNEAVVKTNFFRSNIVAIAFRLQPTFLSADYVDKPHGIFFVVGAEFRGFHTRFADVARGGIRLIKSASPQAYNNNMNGLFDECYSLAITQQRKNKDIPEGGSKGVILLNLAHQDKAALAFAKYVDSILDLLLLPHPQVVDHLRDREILFFGPDENTAELMDWACTHARTRGYPFWKAVTTGKSITLGGIPHDVYGMTTRGVRAFVTGIQRKLGLDADPSLLTKAQTGGPDGDLGSNEIKLGNERTVAVVDGSGVLYDPDGIHHDELLRLATERKMVKTFNRSLLGPKGALVLVEDTDVTLPGGVTVPSGLAFRNNFHLNTMLKAEFFVPCGGRPQAVNVDNVDLFLYGAAADGSAKPASSADGDRSRALRFKYIVEGANLFFTNDARLRIAEKGIILFKDSSANKGGVTSSSLEVLAALSLTDEEFRTHMCVGNDAEAYSGATHAPDFYKTYVREVQHVIEENARLEFECLWAEHERTRTPLPLLSDALSLKITDLSARIENSDSLWSNVPLRTHVLRDALPRTLAALVGGADVIIARLPENYLRALFGSRLASRFIYTQGLNTPEFAFYEYVQGVMASAAAASHPPPHPHSSKKDSLAALAAAGASGMGHPPHHGAAAAAALFSPASTPHVQSTQLKTPFPF